MTQLIKYVDLVIFNVKARLENDHKDHYVGYLWLLLEPLVSALIYYLVFKVLLKRGEDNYIQFLFIGIISWRWFASCVKNGANSIYGSRALYKKIYLPKIVFPWIEILYNTFKFLVIFSAVLLVYICLGSPITMNYLYLPALIFCQFVFVTGISTLLASVLPYFTDLQIIIGFVLRLGFYPTGVLFNLKRIPEEYRYIVDYNPMAQAVHSFRDIVIYGNEPNLYGFLLLLVSGLAMYGIGFFVINKLDKEYAKIT